MPTSGVTPKGPPNGTPNNGNSDYYKGSMVQADEGLTMCEGFTTRTHLTESVDGLVLVLVGLPGRGKSFISRKIESFMNWQCRLTASFNVGQYRRDANEPSKSGQSDFFDAGNLVASALRREAAEKGLADVLKFLDNGGEVAIFDATNTTSERRQMVVETVRAACGETRKYHVLFIEIICDDPEVLRASYVNKVSHSPDFAGMALEDALADLEKRVKKYEERYETISDDEYSYIKLYNMSSKVLVNRIFGFSSKSLLPFLMGVHIGTRPIWLVRTAQVPAGSVQDAELSEEGRLFAERLGAFIKRRVHKFHGDVLPKKPLRAMSSTIPACVQTAFAALSSDTALQSQAFKQTPALNPLDRGIFSGSWWVDQCQDKLPWHLLEKLDPKFFKIWQEDKLLCRMPGGESYYDMMMRSESVLLEIEMSTRPVLCISHITCLQVLLSYFKGTPLEDAWDMAVPEHTVIEITPTLGGTYIIKTINIDEEPLPEVPPTASRDLNQFRHRHLSVPDPTITTSGGNPKSMARKSCPLPEREH